MRFVVIDTQTGKEPNLQKIALTEEWVAWFPCLSPEHRHQWGEREACLKGTASNWLDALAKAILLRILVAEGGESCARSNNPLL